MFCIYTRTGVRQKQITFLILATADNRECLLITKVVFSNQILDNELQIRESNRYFSTESKLGQQG